MTQSKLREANLQVANLGGSDLSGGDLRRADLSGADLVGKKLLRSPEWHPAKLDGDVFTGAKYDRNTKLPFDDAEPALKAT